VRLQVRPVRLQVRPVRLQVRPVRLQVRPVRLQVRPVRLQVTPVRLQVTPVRLQVTPVRLQVRPVRLQVTPVRLQVTLVIAGAPNPSLGYLAFSQPQVFNVTPSFRQGIDQRTSQSNVSGFARPVIEVFAVDILGPARLIQIIGMFDFYTFTIERRVRCFNGPGN
jgi:hypothetical protein